MNSKNNDDIKYHNETIRRQDRLIDKEAALRLLETGEYSVLSMIENRDGNDAGYCIPISYVWNGNDAIYFHCGPEGHKLDCLDANPNVTMCVVGDTQVISHKYTTNYSSIVVRGHINRHLAVDERKHALEMILSKYSPADKEIGMKYAEKSFHRTEILKLTIESISGKGKNVSV